MSFTELALSTWFFQEELEARHLSLISEVGINKIEIADDNFKYDDHRNARLVRETVENLGMEVVSMHGPTLVGRSNWRNWDLSRSNNQWAMDELKKVIDTLSFLGGYILVVHLSFYLHPEPDKINPKVLQHNIAKIAEYCEKKDIAIGVENELALGRRFVNQFESGNIGIVIDTHHPFTRKPSPYHLIYPPTPGIVDTIKECSDNLLHFHANDIAKLSEKEH